MGNLRGLISQANIQPGLDEVYQTQPIQPQLFHAEISNLNPAGVPIGRNILNGEVGDSNYQPLDGCTDNIGLTFNNSKSEKAIFFPSNIMYSEKLHLASMQGRVRKAQALSASNKRIFNRIMSQKTSYPLTKMLQDHKKRGDIARNMSRRPFVLQHSPTRHNLEFNIMITDRIKAGTNFNFIQSDPNQGKKLLRNSSMVSQSCAIWKNNANVRSISTTTHCKTSIDGESSVQINGSRPETCSVFIRPAQSNNFSRT